MKRQLVVQTLVAMAIFAILALVFGFAGDGLFAIATGTLIFGLFYAAIGVAIALFKGNDK